MISRCFRSIGVLFAAGLCILGISGCQAFTKKEEQVLNIYPLQSCYTLSKVATVTVNEQNVPVAYFSKEFDRTRFSFSGKAEIAVTVNEEIRTFTVSPLGKGIEAKAEGNTLRFTIDKSVYMIVKINGIKELVIVADDAETDVPPSSGDGIYNLATDYGADPTGELLATEQIQKAIDDAHAAGGGTVYVPDGLYSFDRGICLKSNVNLYLTGGAVLRSVATPDNYETRCHKNSLKMDVTWLFYTEEGASNIKLYGRGMLDGNGFAMRQDHQYLATILMPLGCSDFTVDGLTLLDGNFWSMIPTRSNSIHVLNVKHINENNLLHENDAIDICECQDVLVKHSLAISEDDTYSTKTWGTGTDIAVQWYGEPEENNNIVFDDCFGWSHCGTYKVGDGNYQPQRNITFKNSYSYKSMSALKLTHGHGTSYAENITFENMDIEGFGGRWESTQKWLDFYHLTDGDVRNVTVRNINVRQTGKTPSTLKGRNATYFYDGVILENIYINGSDTPATTLKAMNITDVNPYVKNLQILPVSEEKEPEDPGNLAFHAAVTVSSSAEGFPGEEAVDGYESTRWGSEYSDNQWITVDMGGVKDFTTVILWWEAAYGKTYTLDISNDGNTWTTVYKETNGKGGKQVLSLGKQSARYVRMKGLTRGTPYGYSLYEFKIRND